MQVLLTRPRRDAAPLADKLSARGFVPLCLPLLTIKFLPTDFILGDEDALVFTSANGSRAFLETNKNKLENKIFAIGEASAAPLKAAGYKNIFIAERANLASLTQLIIASKIKTKIIHIVGRVEAGDLVGSLIAAGLSATKEVLYDAQATYKDNYPPLISAAILKEKDKRQAALIYSKRSAELFLDYWAAEIEGKITKENFIIFCLSAPIADKLNAAGFTTHHPPTSSPIKSEDALLTLLEKFHKNR